MKTKCRENRTKSAIHSPNFKMPEVRAENLRGTQLSIANQDQVFAGFREMRLPYLRVSVTPDCNAACKFCHNEGAKWGRRGRGVRVARPQLSIRDYQDIARLFRDDFDRVKFTGGEPTLAANLPSIVEVFANEGYECSMTSNGFLLTNSLQKILRDAGLTRCNVSLHTTDAEEHEAAFGVPGQLHEVLRNLAAMGRNFAGASKINFMALENVNIPHQLVPMTNLSADVKVRVSSLSLVNVHSTMSSEIIDYLDREIGISSIHNFSKDFCDRQVIEFKNGGAWEFDDFRQPEYRRVAFSNGVCRSCPKRSACTEGPYALRVLADGTLKPCLIRKDNETKLLESSFGHEG